MPFLKRLGIAIPFAVLTVGATIQLSLQAWAYLSVLASHIAFYQGPQLTIVAAIVACTISLIPAAVDRRLWWVGKASTLILAASLIIAPMTFFLLAYKADASNFNRERFEGILYFGMPVVFGFAAAVVVLLCLGIAVLARRLIMRRRRATPDPAPAFD